MIENISTDYFLSTINRFFYSVDKVLSVREEINFICNLGENYYHNIKFL